MAPVAPPAAVGMGVANSDSSAGRAGLAIADAAKSNQAFGSLSSPETTTIGSEGNSAASNTKSDGSPKADMVYGMSLFHISSIDMIGADGEPCENEAEEEKVEATLGGASPALRGPASPKASPQAQGGATPSRRSSGRGRSPTSTATRRGPGSPRSGRGSKGKGRGKGRGIGGRGIGATRANELLLW
mmetsp:Transcript_30728/g.80843  ORF Transcript_30728/g.80843 Transcript_30728/m.80843 type:complete len:187 (-) Transcript_30728:58-618(-)